MNRQRKRSCSPFAAPGKRFPEFQKSYPRYSSTQHIKVAERLIKSHDPDSLESFIGYLNGMWSSCVLNGVTSNPAPVTAA